MKSLLPWRRWLVVVSPPSRGAWIEIVVFVGFIRGVKSPPSRGAWIEIIYHGAKPRKKASRPPRGGRGLKCI